MIQNKTEFLGIRLEPDMARAIEARAAENKMTATKWCREALANALDYDPGVALLLREIMASGLNCD